VPATYYVHLFNRMKREPAQRRVQQLVDSPNMQFYAINEEEPLIASNGLKSRFDSGYADILQDCGFSDMMKLELFTMGKDSLLMRIENLEDPFDNLNRTVRYEKIKLKQLTESLYTLVNGMDTNEPIHLEELTLTAN